ncbi:hypothetical protein [Kitasatospora sp. A2-31]|uniref:hypothetical protein n=1 Tax=Kitasatospora sp. A2-31 TaxID=2916414 RepID=UPI001EECD0CB|nr:hypothetical protein [Kitasatospora sp. A2-31]MCG6497630.1 hypothetical protein [Kitasatospora sp. A2-31]
MTDIITQLTADFRRQYGVQADTAAHMVQLFLTEAAGATRPEAERRFTAAVLRAVDRREPWTHDYTTSYIRTQYPDAASVVASAARAGQDPAAALQAVYGITPAAATELTAYVRATRA